MNTLTILINLLEIIIVRKEYIEGEREPGGRERVGEGERDRDGERE